RLLPRLPSEGLVPRRRLVSGPQVKECRVEPKRPMGLGTSVFQPIGLFQIDHCDPRLSVCHPNRQSHHRWPPPQTCAKNSECVGVDVPTNGTLVIAPNRPFASPSMPSVK